MPTSPCTRTRMWAHPEGEDVRTSSHMTADAFHFCRMSCMHGGATLSLYIVELCHVCLPLVCIAFSISISNLLS
jgi:hypothetical protein